MRTCSSASSPAPTRRPRSRPGSAADAKQPVRRGRGHRAVPRRQPDVRSARTPTSTRSRSRPRFREAVRPTLLAAQRLVKVNPDYSVMSALMADGISSAQQIYCHGPRSLRRRVRHAARARARPRRRGRGRRPSRPTLSRSRSPPSSTRRSVRRARSRSASVLPENVADAGRRVPKPADAVRLGLVVRMRGLPVGARRRRLPRRHARVPQAALGQSAAPDVRDVLLERRRPDIAQIQLSCPNTDTELPYIDLVNELLEDAVAPPAIRPPPNRAPDHAHHPGAQRQPRVRQRRRLRRRWPRPSTRGRCRSTFRSPRPAPTSGSSSSAARS